MTSPIKKPASRITLEDLFGSANPSLAEIDAAAANALAERKSGRRKSERRRDPSKPLGSDARLAEADRQARMQAIRDAATKMGQEPNLQKHWHPQALVYVEHLFHCTCGHQSVAPAAANFLVRYINVRTGATHTLDPSGPIDYRLPRVSTTLPIEVAVCSSCFAHKSQDL